MDYSKLTPEQLLELLKTQSPDMYSALTEPINDPGHWSDGENPMDYYSANLSRVLGRGYDPNLIVEEALQGPNLFNDTDQNRILFELGHINTNSSNTFPSDNLIGEDLNWYGDGPIPGAAAASAHYTFDALSDEELLEYLKRNGLTNI